MPLVKSLFYGGHNLFEDGQSFGIAELVKQGLDLFFGQLIEGAHQHGRLQLGNDRRKFLGGTSSPRSARDQMAETIGIIGLGHEKQLCSGRHLWPTRQIRAFARHCEIKVPIGITKLGVLSGIGPQFS